MENSTENIIGDQSRQNTILCLACMKENNGAATFCRFCNHALSLTNNPDHLAKNRYGRRGLRQSRRGQTEHRSCRRSLAAVFSNSNCFFAVSDFGDF